VEGVQEATLDTQPLPQLRSRLEIRTIGVSAGKPVSLPAECEGVFEQRCPQPGRSAGRNTDGASLGYRSGVATETGHQQSDRIVLVDGAVGGTQRKTLARRKSAAALDGHRTPGSREEVPTHQGLSRHTGAERALESLAYSAEGGPNLLHYSTSYFLPSVRIDESNAFAYGGSKRRFP